MQQNTGLPDDTVNLPLVVGVDLGGTQLRTAVLRGPTLLSRVGMLTGTNPAPERILPLIYKAVEQALAEAHVGMDAIAGIGIAAPGPLDHRTGIVFEPPNMPGWNRVPLRDLFAERFHVPVYVENDANACCLGEYMFGAGRGYSMIVYMTISTGIGGGVIINGEIMEGASGIAAELGHMTIDRYGERCTCGNIGCLEYIASGTAIARHANKVIHAGEGAELLNFARTMLQHSDTVTNQAGLPTMPGYEGETVELRFPPSSDSTLDQSQKTQEMLGIHEMQETQPEDELVVNARTVALAAEAGVPVARAIIQDAAEALGIGLVNVIHIFNPDVIILGGGVTEMGPMLMEPALHVVQEHAMKVSREAAHIVLAQLGHNVGLVGAGALIYHYGKRGKNGGTEGTA
ncbi:MAG TPA: ROK family protein [Ktedonobacteraceae bacterium]|nr:ROK family protein [Ktedonobacteraceae bacterium]